MSPLPVGVFLYSVLPELPLSPGGYHPHLITEETEAQGSEGACFPIYS